MPKPTSKGRMIRRDIRSSKKFASLSKEAMILFCLIIPHLSSHGKMNGSPYYIKGEVVPLIPWFSLELIEQCLLEISQKTNVKWFKRDGLWYIHSLKWQEHQELREDRLGDDDLPDYSTDSAGELRENSGSSPGVLRPEVEVEVEVEVKDEVEVKVEEEPYVRPEAEQTDSGLEHDKPSKPPEVVVKACPYQKIVDLYNSTCSMLPQVRDLTPRREKLLKARWVHDAVRQDLSWWQEFFGRVAASPFLTGQVDSKQFPGWKADFDWIINPNNFAKILEGKYDSKGQKSCQSHGSTIESDGKTKTTPSGAGKYAGVYKDLADSGGSE